MPELRGGGGELIWAMPESKRSFFREVIPYSLNGHGHIGVTLPGVWDAWMPWSPLEHVLLRVELGEGIGVREISVWINIFLKSSWT